MSSETPPPSADAFVRRFWAAHRDVVARYPPLQLLTEPSRFTTTAAVLGRYCPSGSTLVDVGAWPGTFAACLARLDITVVAIDKDVRRPICWDRDEMLGGGAGAADGVPSLAALCQQEGVRAVSADIEREPLPLETGSVDVVLFTEVIEHLWHDPLLTLSEINRVLRVSGTVILSTNNFTSLRNRISFLAGDIDKVIEHPFVSFLKARRVGHFGHIRQYAPEELTAMMHLMGFRRVEMFYSWYDPGEDVGKTPAGVSPAGTSAAASDAPSPRPVARASILRKFIRSPRAYWSAATATSLRLAEQWVPRLRPQMYIVARKEKDADFDRNYPAETRQLVRENKLLV